MKRKAEVHNQPPKRHFDLAEAVAAFYGTEWGEAAVEQFRQDAAWHRTRLHKRSQLDWMTYVIRLLLTCPVLLQRPQGLEWVVDDLRWTLNNRHISKDVERDFWAAVGNVRTILATGHPASRGRDFLRYQLIHAMMNQVTTDPEKGLVKVKGMGKTEAVKEMAELEQKRSGRKPYLREIWGSLKWVEDYLAKIKEQLE
jgi:hypothetical protein